MKKLLLILLLILAIFEMRSLLPKKETPKIECNNKFILVSEKKGWSCIESEVWLQNLK